MKNLFAALAAYGIALQQRLSNALQQGLKKAAMYVYRLNSAIAYGTIATIALSVPVNEAMAVAILRILARAYPICLFCV